MVPQTVFSSVEYASHKAAIVHVLDVAVENDVADSTHFKRVWKRMCQKLRVIRARSQRQ